SIQQRIYGLADRLRKKLSEIDGITLTDEGVEKCGIVTFISNRLSPPDIKAALSRKRINVSTSKGSGSLVSFRERGLEEVVRTSVHYFNTDEEIDYFAETLDRLTKR
ncbi:MAG: aminotransferase class V-fold PLP-dependent enzyme, partial [Desulfovibrionales bacterium]|nr:aminotransferase class V-fold PLP-dependent enzyme [Desulfovibrionales bacterium]